MPPLIPKTGERILPARLESKEEYLLYLRHLFVYEFAKKHVQKDSFIMDLGCGEGYGANQLSQCGMKIIGLDVDANTVAHASSVYGSNNSCSFKIYDGVDIPYKDNTFDAVVSSHVIEHIQDDIHCIGEVARILKKGGIFILTTPNKTHRLKPGQKPWNKFHVREYYPRELEHALKSSFPDAKVWGIRGTKEIQDIEMRRIKKGSRIISFDPFNLRKFVPPWLKQLLINSIRKPGAGGSTKKMRAQEFLTKYGINDYSVTRDNVNDSLDLLGICKK